MMRVIGWVFALREIMAYTVQLNTCSQSSMVDEHLDITVEIVTVVTDNQGENLQTSVILLVHNETIPAIVCCGVDNAQYLHVQKVKE